MRHAKTNPTVQAALESCLRNVVLRVPNQSLEPVEQGLFLLKGDIGTHSVLCVLFVVYQWLEKDLLQTEKILFAHSVPKTN